MTKIALVQVGLLSVVLLMWNGCSESNNGQDGGVDAGYPDPGFVHDVEGRSETAIDEEFLQERPTLYRTLDRIPDTDVRCLAVYDQQVWAGTGSGLASWNSSGDSFEVSTMIGTQDAVNDLADRKLDDGRLALLATDRLILHDPAGLTHEAFPLPHPSSSVATDGSRVWVGTSQGLYELVANALELVPEVPSEPIQDLALDGSDLWIATLDGLLSLDAGLLTTHNTSDGSLPDDDVRAVSALPGGGVIAACATGAAVVGSPADDRLLDPGLGALPTDDLTCASAGEDTVLLGHAIGATHITGDFIHKDYYHTLRWIPGQRVTAVAMQGDRRRWIGTEAGVSRVDLVPTTLSAKAELMESYNAGFWRLDFVSDDGVRDDAWDLEAPIRNHDHDNDGLWTQMQIVAWSYAGASTGDQSYCENARRAMGAMLWQIDIPAVTFEAAGKARGFVTRSFVRDDEGTVFTSKETQDNWHLVEGWEDGHDYYWKDDTSSDETTGHFFGYPVYYDLCADEQEREVLAEHVGALARYIIDHDFELIDLDGEKTSHGHWNPDRLAICLDGLTECMDSSDLETCAEACYGGGWLNGIEILGHMLAAWHMTGDPVFYDAYEELITEQRYDELVDFHDEILTVTSRAIANHSDHELAMLAYHTLIRYEPNEGRRQRWIQSLQDMFAHEILERNPCWAAIVAMAAAEGYHLPEALQTLREWPEDWREWRVDNSHRRDYAVDPANDRFGDPQFTTVPPYDEIRTLKWNTNPYQITGGGDGRAVQAPWPWLLPYWMMRYHGVIQ